MTAMIIFLAVLHVPVLFFLFQPLIQVILFQLKKLLGGRSGREATKSKKEFDFALIVTAYKDVDLIPPLVDSVNKNEYSNYTLYVVADRCDTSRLDLKKASKVRLIEPEKPLDSKIASIRLAIDRFERAHDVMVILDNDNLVSNNYLAALNEKFCQGYRAVQTNLRPKNTDSVYARLDAVSNLFMNFTDRHFMSEFGLSSFIYGLGIAIEMKLYNELNYGQIVGGFDKKLQVYLADSTIIGYEPQAKVFDEKVGEGEVIRNQRTRWLNSYFNFAGLGFYLMGRSLSTFSLRKFYFALNVLRLPWVVLGLAILFLALIDLFVSPGFLYLLLGGSLALVASIPLALKIEKAPSNVLTVLPQIPKFIFWQLLSLLQLRKAKKEFLHTRHDRIVYIDDISDP